MAEPRPEPARLTPRWLLVVWLAAFAAVAVVAAGPGTLYIDASVLEQVQRLPATPWRTVFDIGNLFGTTPASPLALAVLALLCLRRRLPWGVAFCLALMFLRGIGWFAKRLFDSPRPALPLAEVRARFDGLGFPSGHALTATVIAGAVTVLVPRLVGRRPVAVAIVVLTWLWAIACGLARIWYGAHWPSDVLGGFLLGLAFIWLSSEIAGSTLVGDWFPGPARHRRRQDLHQHNP